MVIRRERKLKKYLGSRTRGAGDTKNRRGAGSKGGKGNTGRWRHKKTSFMHLLGAKITQKPKTIEIAINLFDLNNYIENGIMSGRFKDNIVLDFAEDDFLVGYDKVVARGNINYKVALKNVKCSKRVKEMVEAKGGLVE